LGVEIVTRRILLIAAIGMICFASSSVRAKLGEITDAIIYYGNIKDVKAPAAK
jgi:hypothetical protein